MSQYHDRPPDFETDGAKIWFRNPEAREQSLMKAIAHLHKKWLKGETVFSRDIEEKAQGV